MRNTNTMNTTVPSEKAFSRDEQRQHKRMAVLCTGAKLFRERGFDRTSLDDIAGALNVSKRTLYYYVESKDEILFQCNMLAIEFMDDAIQQVHTGTAAPLRRIEMLLRSYARLLANDFGACLALIRTDWLSEEYRVTLHQGRRKMDTVLRELIQQGIDDGSLAPCDPKYAAAAIFGAFNWVPHWHTDKESLSYEQIADHLLTTLINGLQARA